MGFMRVLSVGLIVGLLCMGSVHGAVYNLPSHLINIPIVNSYDQWDMEFGVSTGFNNNEIYDIWSMDPNDIVLLLPKEFKELKELNEN